MFEGGRLLELIVYEDFYYSNYVAERKSWEIINTPDLNLVQRQVVKQLDLSTEEPYLVLESTTYYDHYNRPLRGSAADNKFKTFEEAKAYVKSRIKEEKLEDSEDYVKIVHKKLKPEYHNSNEAIYLGGNAVYQL